MIDIFKIFSFIAVNNYRFATSFIIILNEFYNSLTFYISSIINFLYAILNLLLVAPLINNRTWRTKSTKVNTQGIPHNYNVLVVIHG